MRFALSVLSFSWDHWIRSHGGFFSFFIIFFFIIRYEPKWIGKIALKTPDNRGTVVNGSLHVLYAYTLLLLLLFTRVRKHRVRNINTCRNTCTTGARVRCWGIVKTPFSRSSRPLMAFPCFPASVSPSPPGSRLRHARTSPPNKGSESLSLSLSYATTRVLHTTSRDGAPGSISLSVANGIKRNTYTLHPLKQYFPGHEIRLMR